MQVYQNTYMYIRKIKYARYGNIKLKWALTPIIGCQIWHMYKRLFLCSRKRVGYEFTLPHVLVVVYFAKV